MRERSPSVPVDGLDIRKTTEFPSLRVCSDGRIMGPRGAWLKPRTEPSGYQVVGITRNARAYPVRVHVVVCTAFHGPRPTPQHEVAHANGVKSDNRAENLRWATHPENEADKAQTGTLLLGERRWNAKLTAEDVREIRRRIAGGEVKRRLAAEFGVTPTAIQAVASRRSWKHVA